MTSHIVMQPTKLENASQIGNKEEDIAMDEEQSLEQTSKPIKAQELMDTKTPESRCTPELMKVYYRRLFPFELLHSWLSYDTSCFRDKISGSETDKKSSGHDDKNLFARREFSFTIDMPDEGGKGSNAIFMRYNSFRTCEEMRKAVTRRCPSKIDIGAVYKTPPKNSKSLQGGAKLQTEERELVFDIDLTDYDSVRNCGCSGAKICGRCWKMMTAAVKVLDAGLKEDFGFRNIAWFYSGRRGVHAWICDKTARNLSNEGRSAVAAYFEVSRKCQRSVLGHQRAHLVMEKRLALSAKCQK